MATEEVEIVIAGGGICGLATALALHRKGIKSVVLERSDNLRITEGAITIQCNGWSALRELGLDKKLQSTSVPFQQGREVFVDRGVVQETRMSANKDAYCIRRADLIEAMANELPSETLCFNSQVVSIYTEKPNSNPIIQLSNGSSIKARVLIGCDGTHSVIADYIGLSPTKVFSKWSVRGLTTYPNGHGFPLDFCRTHKGNYYIGRIPIDQKTVYFISIIDAKGEMPKAPESIRAFALDLVADFPTEIVEMIKKSECQSLSLTRLRYRTPWSIMFGEFCKGTTTVAGDAWHPMSPFLGQGGAASLEDAIVLARCLSSKAYDTDANGNRVFISERKAREALDDYIRERRPRIVQLSTQTYLMGVLLAGKPSFFVGLLCKMLLAVLFRDPLKHARYDCGKL